MITDDEGMSGIVTALEAHHDIRPAGQPVDHFALALISPLGADDRHIRHFVSSATEAMALFFKK